MKKLVFFVCPFVICLCVSVFNENTSEKTKDIESPNVVSTKNIVKLPLPNSDQQRYHVIKLPINNGKVEIKQLNKK